MNISRNNHLNSGPKLFGPGNWHSLHLMAANANTTETKKSVLWFIKILSNNFYCLKCKEDFLEYIKKDNPSLYINQKEGLFYWSYNFHNSVNKKLNKPIMSYEEAKKLYFSPEVCVEHCFEEESEELPTIFQKEIIEHKNLNDFKVQKVIPKDNQKKKISKIEAYIK
uniref:thiol oxidase n=1 Tax=viral metagenome TaxID=1070528 RepID=A0A6C0AG00_9ZZZZ